MPLADDIAGSGPSIVTGFSYCFQCGSLLDVSSDPDPEPDRLVTPPAAYRVSGWRVAIMVFVSFGLYFFYWFYRTWRDYQDGTGDKVYPVWHALTLLVPIYGLFRAHYHFKLFKFMMLYRMLPGTISPAWNVAGLLVVGLWGLSWAFFGLDSLSLPLAWTLDLFDIVSLAGYIVWALALLFLTLASLQGDLKRLWCLHDGVDQAAPFALGEWVFAGIGVLIWCLYLQYLVRFLLAR